MQFTDEMITKGNLTFQRTMKWQGTEPRQWAKGFSKVDVWIRIMPTNAASREIQRDLAALKLSGNLHENIVRFIGSEEVTIDKKYT
jgi:hypothetical protein